MPKAIEESFKNYAKNVDNNDKKKKAIDQLLDLPDKERSLIMRYAQAMYAAAENEEGGGTLTSCHLAR